VNVFDEMGSYWGEIAEKDQTEKQLQFLKNTLKTEGWVLDVACGTGRHLIPLGKEGYNVVGLDISGRLLKIAKNRWRSPQLVRADMRCLPFKTKVFSAAVSMDTSFGYLPSEEDDRKSLTEIRRALKHSGIFIVDVFNRIDLIAKYQGKNPEAKSKDYPSFTLTQKRAISDKGDLLCDSWMIRDKFSGEVKFFAHTARLYDVCGLQVLLGKAKFCVKQVWGDYEGQKFDFESRRLILLATTVSRERF
jgi:SAM-dependent methyltransferase